ncbi:alpha 1,2 mannosyltransferase [Exophiala xenobiotica]|uniref:Mannosyltransferase n=1 Tax=Vermiconidia calcicola TaxID=1690605 RepID=A0AAV9Q1H0_9PEZI|nr:alpha 1,2 mannosyltransferase [Exophiala xenobiotica]KAK5533887.1 alpha 1,2 mannosyltransferase [Vermiconidia calcicola]KAK5546438.1 alpha 1,2 mannosyltransferase [Chaetothyriales sp. CCFEE 6169]KAK5291824.1 alpha 1,2 mannosyltransferase [Exophiala xenobiotica]KAK5342097.1 alpha 1,2 mannosyltransferase [Exophiala xenobiotica]
MWRLVYLFLLFVRVYLALCPSYLHPDEIFQGPEPIAGYLFPYPSHRTWEWTSSHPIRSVFPLWPIYGLPMALLKWTWAQDDDGLVDPHTIYYALRLVMFVLSFVLEDWAVHDLVRSPRHRRDAVVLVCSSYVTWTFQTHTFSNAVETILVLWSLVVIERIVGENKRSAIASCVVLGFLLVFGTFNRITFPAFVVIPGIQLLPHFLNRPFCLLALVLSGTFWTLVAIVLDTAYYSDAAATRSFRALYDHVRHAPVITPLNNVLYNTQTSNLAQHGLHPHYQHFLINLPQLLGPAIILLVASAYPFNLRILKATLSNARLASATTGTLLLSLFPHQEPRFLLPTIPLFLSCIRLPTSTIWRRTFWASWILFNTALAILMGIYHQGGIIATQLAIPSLLAQSITHTQSRTHNIEVFWWKTYPPPNFLLGTEPRHPLTNSSLNISTVPLMGFPQSELVFMLMQHMPTCDPSLIERLILHKEKTDVFVVAPLAAWRLEATEPPSSNFSFSVAFNIPPAELIMTNIFTYRQHINLDDMDFGDDGVLPTLHRVIGRRGLGVWKVDRICGPVEYVDKHTGERVVPNKVLEQEEEGDANIQEERQMPSSTDSVAEMDAVPTITTTLASHLHISAEVS